MESQEQRSKEGSRVPQMVTALVSTMGAFSMGMIIGYASSASLQLQNMDNVNRCPLIQNKTLDSSAESWFSSTMNLGAAAGAPIVGILVAKLGRRYTMMLAMVPGLIGWILLGTSSNIAMLIFGRIFAGACAGLASLSVPPYLAEIASPSLRGTLGTGFQLMCTIGILVAYGIGSVTCYHTLAFVSLAPALLFGIGMFFCKESPTYLVSKGRDDEAKQVLHFFRGKQFDVEPEFKSIKDSHEASVRNTASVGDLFTKKYNLHPLAIAMALMFFQQFTGINAILFNTSNIFSAVKNISLTGPQQSIIIAAVQVPMTALASFLMDKTGRRVLLLVSSALMTVALVICGIYFYLAHNGHDVTSIGWLPVFSLVLFIAFFAIGFGPIPWLMMGEIFSADVVAMGCTIATITNWMMSFVVTFIFNSLSEKIHNYGCFWFFAAFNVVAFFFCMFFVKETKGKTSQEIGLMFNNPNAIAASRPKEGIENPVEVDDRF